MKHSDIDHSGITGVGGGGLEFTPMAKVAVFNGSTTGASVTRTLTAAISGVPADAELVTGWISLSVNAAANNGNYFALAHENVNEEWAVILRASAASGIVVDAPFTVKCVQSSGAKVYYELARAAGTLTYFMNITGYWAPA